MFFFNFETCMEGWSLSSKGCLWCSVTVFFLYKCLYWCLLLWFQSDLCWSRIWYTLVLEILVLVGSSWDKIVFSVKLQWYMTALPLQNCTNFGVACNTCLHYSNPLGIRVPFCQALYPPNRYSPCPRQYMMEMNKEDSLRGKIILSFHDGLMEEAAKEVRFSDSSAIALQPLWVT